MVTADRQVTKDKVASPLNVCLGSAYQIMYDELYFLEALYKSYLASSDFHLFGLFKKALRGRRFASKWKFEVWCNSDFTTDQKPSTRKAYGSL
ncbi:hypothetical protein TNCV_1962151 [Trichonephila clavipes]|nr:hypothetical protein TNCV_1962151 [Trichonephila clavipes]